MKPYRFLWTAPWWRSLIEIALVGFPIFWVTTLFGIYATDYNRRDLFLLEFFIFSLIPVTYGALRCRYQPVSLKVQFLFEAAMNVGCFSALLLAWEVGQLGGSLTMGGQGSYQTLAESGLILFISACAYFPLRIGGKLWLLWERMRRARFVWSLTHAFLLFILGFFFVGVFVIFLPLLVVLNVSNFAPEMPFAVRAINLTFSLLLSVLVSAPFALLPPLILLFPPMILGAYMMTRKLTRRLNLLEEAARKLSQGDLSARVPPEGEDEITQLQMDFNVMAGRLEKASQDLVDERDRVSGLLEAQRELTASVSHELRTPVATTLAYLDNSLEHWAENSPEVTRQNLEVARHEMERLRKLIEDLFILSKVQVNQLSLNLGPVDLLPLVENAVKTVEMIAWNTRRVRVTSDLPSELPPVWADAGRVEQILANLINNSIRHTPPGGFVVVSASIADQIHVSVSDSGEGISAEDLPHIWERFYKGSSSASEGRTGLGLAIVKELVESMGGSVSVESEPEQGSTFTFTLPVQTSGSNL